MVFLGLEPELPLVLLFPPCEGLTVLGVVVVPEGFAPFVDPEVFIL